MNRSILIVDDHEMNRIMLKNILKDEYQILEAKNGVEALQILKEEFSRISAVLLDLVMPEMNGYEVLERIQADADMAKVPVVVATGMDDVGAEEKALEAGAVDFVTKPYQPKIIKNRLRNMINLREQAAIVNATRIDALTGLLSRAAFFEQAREKIDLKEPGYYVMGAFDIDRFRVINDQYGTDRGDKILRQIADVFRSNFKQFDACISRIGADNFAILYPKKFSETEAVTEIRRQASVLDGTLMPLVYSIGRYYVDDTSLEVSVMYDRAVMAKESVKGRYDHTIGIYEDSLREKILHEQSIVSDMRRALENHEYEVWYQPQFSNLTGNLVGAEALVRWNHPERGLIRPDLFIPIFEKNGFIYELDKYVWRESCRFVRKVIDAKLPAIPVSVNVSRYDIYRADVVEVLVGLVQEYGLSQDLIRIEITESAFAESNSRIANVIQQFKEYGFLIEIDDFGSGYSSLNTLKDVPADVLKLDMKFLKGESNSEKGGSILESIIRMAKWLGMSIIAEGVEKQVHADFLKSVGCYYIQGYLYSKPITEHAYYEMIQKNKTFDKMMAMEKLEAYNNEAFWTPESMDSLIFNSYVGGACLIEYENNSIEVIRVNDKFVSILGAGTKKYVDPFKKEWKKYLSQETIDRALEAVHTAIETREEVSCEFELLNYRGDGETLYIHVNIRVIARMGENYLIYCVLEDITEQRRAEKKERSLMTRLQAIMTNMSGGVAASIQKEDGFIEVVFANERFYEQRGYTKEQYEAEVHNLCDVVHPEDVSEVLKKYEFIKKTNTTVSAAYRIIRRDKKVIWVSGRISRNKLEDFEKPVFINVMVDITREFEAVERQRETDRLMHMILDSVASGITAVTLDGKNVNYEFANDKFCKMLGYTKEQFRNEVTEPYTIFYPEDREWVYETVNGIQPGEPPCTIECRVICRDQSTKHIKMTIVSKRDEKEDKNLQMSLFEDVTDKYREEEYRTELIENIPCGAGLFSLSDGHLNVIYLNNKYWNMVGRKADAANVVDVEDAILPDERADLLHTVNEIIEKKQEQELELHILNGNGEYLPFLVRANAMAQKEGNIMLYVIYTPIQEDAMAFRRMLPNALETMMASSNDFAFVKDRAFRYVCASRAFAKLTGHEDEKELIGKTDYDLFTKDLADKYRADDRSVLESTSAIVDMIERLPQKDGPYRYVTTSKYILRDANQNLIGLYGVGRDITRDKDAYDRLKTLTDTIPGGLATYELSEDGLRTLYISDGVCDIIEYQKKEIDISRNPLNFVVEEDREQLKEQLYKIFITGKDMDSFCRLITKYGEYRWVNIRATEIDRQNYAEDSEQTDGKQGVRVTINTVMFDVTEQVQAREKIRIMEQENKNRYEHELQIRKELVKDSVFYYTLNLTTGIVEEYESKNNEISVMKRGEIIDDTIMDYIISKIMPEDVPMVKKNLFIDGLREKYTRGEKNISLNYRRMLSDGIYHWMRMDVYIMEKPNSKEVIAFLYCKDIDCEWKNHLAISTILDEDIESIFHINVHTKTATIAHMIEAKNYNKLYHNFDFDVEGKISSENVVMKEDKDVFAKFYCVQGLIDRLQEEQIATITYRVLEGSEVHRKIAKAYYLDEHKNEIVLIRRDITKLDEEEQKQKRELQDAVEKANRASRAKSEFLSNMSHDIRTPLNAIMSFSGEELTAGADDITMREYLSKINVSGKYLMGIINDVLDMSRIERNRVILTPEVYSLEEFRATICNIIDELSKNKSIHFNMDTSKAQVDELLYDQVRFNQIFINLLSNAVKFTPAGGNVEFIIEQVQEDQKESTMRFIVRDDGIGMSEEFVPHAFESFSQEYRKDSPNKDQGTGLGLSIVYELVKLMGGTILLDSIMYKGTTFTVEFPLAKVINRRKSQRFINIVRDYSKMQDMHILLAEDNAINAEIAITLLKKKGCIVDWAENGEEAVHQFIQSKEGYYQLILMDIRMPLMTGLEATVKIRSLPRKDAGKIPIIAMTADTFTEDENIALKVGMNAHIGKPIVPVQLYNVCVSCLEER